MRINPISFKGLIKIDNYHYINTNQIREIKLAPLGGQIELVYQNGESAYFKTEVENMVKAFSEAEGDGKIAKLDCWR